MAAHPFIRCPFGRPNVPTEMRLRRSIGRKSPGFARGGEISPPHDGLTQGTVLPYLGSALAPHNGTADAPLVLPYPKDAPTLHPKVRCLRCGLITRLVRSLAARTLA